MLQLLKINTDLKSHAEHFAERYDRLLGWALHLTDHDRAQAEDLLHDAFIQFTLTAPDLGGIRNLENYLFGVLRILRVSQLRRNARLRLEQLSIIDYDSAELGLRMIRRAGDSIQIQDELRAICRYACARKETSKAGGVLILRFFHGYYPSEIAAVLLSSRKVADMRLQAARREARAYIDAPERLSFINAAAPLKKTGANMTTQTADNLLLELREEIFRARTGECYPPDELRRMYTSNQPDAIGNEQLSHIVSCAACLDVVNQILGLPELAERHPNDTLDKDTRGQNGGGDGGASGGGGEAIKRQSQHRAREVFEHRPQELFIAVNGFILGSQAIHAEVNEQTLELRETDLAEPPSFLEVFSEQGLRLLLMPIESPPDGSGQQAMKIRLSDERELELNLQLRAPHTAIHVVYCDPLMKSESAFQPNEFASAGSGERNPLSLKAGLQTPSWPRRLLTKVFGAHPLWRPGVVAALGLLLAAMVLLSVWRWPSTPVVTAAELLQKSIAAETQTAAARGQTTHRGLTLEERDPATARVIASRRVEIWESADRGITARRLYDEQNRIIAGQWKQTDGSSRLYQRQAKAGGRDSTDMNDGIGGEALWQTALAPQSFAKLVGTAEARMDERKDSYVLSYEFPAGTAANRHLLKATLVLIKSDLRAVEQTMLVRNAELREYRVVESNFEQLPASSVPAAVFQPDPELLDSGAQLIETAPSNPKAEAASQLGARSTAPNAAEQAALEIEARYLLDQVNANLGEQVSFTREGNGKLRIAALVETDKRKAELIAALEPLRSNPAAAFDIATYAEAARRAPRTKGALTISEFEASQNQIPAAADLRRYFAEATRQSQPQANEWIENRIAEFANRIQAQAMKPLRHARALKTLVEQIPPAEFARLNPEAKAKWQQMVQSHALAAQRETAGLRAELEPIFFAATTQDPAATSGNELNLKQAVERLAALTAHHDAVIGQAFARSAAPASAATLKSNQFRQSLLEAEAVARVISKQQ